MLDRATALGALMTLQDGFFLHAASSHVCTLQCKVSEYYDMNQPYYELANPGSPLFRVLVLADRSIPRITAHLLCSAKPCMLTQSYPQDVCIPG